MKQSVLVGDHLVTMIDEPTYSRNSTDNLRSYQKEFSRTEGRHHFSSAHGVRVGNIENPEASIILLGIRGATSVHSDSIAHNEGVCFAAVGDAVVALRIPGLEIVWWKQVDIATCLAVHWCQPENCLFVWGELAVTRLSPTGEVVWSVRGRDAFTEGFEITEQYIKATDFYHEEYFIHLKSGDFMDALGK
jgi:hypothetical protein